MARLHHTTTGHPTVFRAFHRSLPKDARAALFRASQKPGSARAIEGENR